MSKKIYLENDYYFDVQFSDIDVVDIMWHGHYIRYMENARFAMFKTVGYGYEEMVAKDVIWPLIKIDIKYIRPIQMGDRIRINTRLVEMEHRLVVDYMFYDNDNNKICKACSHQMAIDVNTREAVYEVPKLLQEAIKNAPKS